MFAFEEQSKWSKVVEISTWVLLFVVLVPGTALGYFAETSLPNTPLYPIKRGLESVVLTLTSFSKNTKTLYEINLANVRLQETKQIVTSKQGITTEDLSQFDAVMAQLDEAKASITTVNDTTQKQQMQQQLTQTRDAYKAQLAQLQQQLQNQNSTTTNSSSAQPSQDTRQTNQANQDIPTPTPPPGNTPNISNLSQEDKTTLEQKIQDISTQLDNLDTTTNDAQQMDTSQNPPPPTFTPTPTRKPWWPFHTDTTHHTDGGQDTNQQDTSQEGSTSH